MMAELHEVMHLIVRHILLPSSGSTPYILTFAPNTELRNHGMMGAVNLEKLPSLSHVLFIMTILISLGV